MSGCGRLRSAVRTEYARKLSGGQAFLLVIALSPKDCKSTPALPAGARLGVAFSSSSPTGRPGSPSPYALHMLIRVNPAGTQHQRSRGQTRDVSQSGG